MFICNLTKTCLFQKLYIFSILAKIVVQKWKNTHIYLIKKNKCKKKPSQNEKNKFFFKMNVGCIGSIKMVKLSILGVFW